MLPRLNAPITSNIIQVATGESDFAVAVYFEKGIILSKHVINFVQSTSLSQ